MNYEKINTVYFIGIGGIGMSAIAQYFLRKEKQVYGYDKTPSDITIKMESLNIPIQYDNSLNCVERLDKTSTLAVYTPAVPKEHTLYQYLEKEGFVIKKRAEVLADIVAQTFCIAVAGTHGKTTVSAIIAHILIVSGRKVTAFLGGVLENYDNNYISIGDEITVVEADEYDRSFLKLNPNIIGITAMDSDHLDVYKSSSHLEESFKEFASKVDVNNRFINENLSLQGKTYGFENSNDYRVENIEIEGFKTIFDVVTPICRINHLEFFMAGKHNVNNALLAIAICLDFGVDELHVREALATFKGVKRRFSCQINRSDFVYIDDYAHHPKEIDAVYDAVITMFPDKDNLVVFQPHLFSRTRDFIDDFAKSLSQFDHVALLDIYPARELPIDGVKSEVILDKITHNRKYLIAKDKVIDLIKQLNPKVLLTLGAGDIGEDVQKIKKVFS